MWAAPWPVRTGIDPPGSDCSFGFISFTTGCISDLLLWVARWDSKRTSAQIIKASRRSRAPTKCAHNPFCSHQVRDSVICPTLKRGVSSSPGSVENYPPPPWSFFCTPYKIRGTDRVISADSWLSTLSSAGGVLLLIMDIFHCLFLF